MEIGTQHDRMRSKNKTENESKKNPAKNNILYSGNLYKKKVQMLIQLNQITYINLNNG